VDDDMRESLRTLAETSLGERLSNPAARRERAAEALLRHPDPVLREIGQQIRDGSMRPSDVLRIPAYRDAFGRAAAQVSRDLDAKAVAAELRSLAARATRPS
jgi:hypothetical protein